MTLCKSGNNRGLGVWVSGRGHCVDPGLTEGQTFISISLVRFMVARKRGRGGPGQGQGEVQMNI